MQAFFAGPINNLHIYSFAPVAAYIKASKPNGASIVCMEPGALSWYLGPKYKVTDALGLASPGVGKHRMQGDVTWVYTSTRPDYIYYYDYSLQPIVKETWFESNYRLAGEYPSLYWEVRGHASPELYERKGPWAETSTTDTLTR